MSGSERTLSGGEDSVWLEGFYLIQGELCLVQAGFCLFQGGLLLVQGELCLIQENSSSGRPCPVHGGLCLIQVGRCPSQGGLCLIHGGLYLVQRELCLTEVFGASWSGQLSRIKSDQCIVAM
jgi:hypothetical protein